jgi:hypothetical protein
MKASTHADRRDPPNPVIPTEVKRSERSGGTLRFRPECSASEGFHRKPNSLPQNQIDFVAAYIIPLDLWCILPAPVTTRLHEHISLSPIAGLQIRAVWKPGTCCCKPPHPVIPTGAKRKRAQWRDLAFPISRYDRDLTTHRHLEAALTLKIVILRRQAFVAEGPGAARKASTGRNIRAFGAH